MVWFPKTLINERLPLLFNVRLNEPVLLIVVLVAAEK